MARLISRGGHATPISMQILVINQCVDLNVEDIVQVIGILSFSEHYPRSASSLSPTGFFVVAIIGYGSYRLERCDASEQAVAD